MSAVRDRLREQSLPGEAEAAARTWPVVEAALSGRAPERARRRAPLRLALAAAVLGTVLLTVLSPAGAWIGDRFADDDGSGPPTFAALPDGGSVLAISGSGAYAIHPDGSFRRLGSFSDAGWSPNGLHVVGADGRRLSAVDPRGTLKWTLARPRRVHHPSWSLGRGFAVAYLEGGTLRAVAGNGDPATDRPLSRRAAPVTPAWRPGSDRVLTYARRDGSVETVDAASGGTLWRAEVRGARSLAWSRDGRRLVVLSPRAVTVLGADGGRLRVRGLPGTGRELALHPSGDRAAVVVGSGSRTRVLGLPLMGGGGGQLFQGDVDGLAWSSDGRRLLIAWRDTGQWLVLGPGRRIRALHDVSRELGAAGGFLRVAGWCCPG